MNAKKTNISVEINDLYQFLIEECRYGYRRNNHLMPEGAYEHVREYLPKMLKKNTNTALHTACQLCEECISMQLTTNFYDGLDDEFNNRAEAIEFIEWLLKWIHDNASKNVCDYISYNYSHFYPWDINQYNDNIERCNNIKYRVYELDSFDKTANKIREVTTEPITKKEVDNLIFTKELNVVKGVFNRIDIKTDKYPVRVVGEIIKIIEPKSHKGRIYSIELVK